MIMESSVKWRQAVANQLRRWTANTLDLDCQTLKYCRNQIKKVQSEWLEVGLIVVVLLELLEGAL